jgi:putative ABC transport system permease protein
MIAVRNLLRSRSYSLINIVGLALGIACCILVYSYVRHELSFDEFHKRKENIFRVNLLAKTPSGGIRKLASEPMPLGPTLKETFSDINHACRVIAGNAIVQIPGREAIRQSVLYVDPDFFRLFTFPLITGNGSGVLTHKSSVVLSEAAAHRYFGSEPATGKVLTLTIGDSTSSFIIDGVAATAPENSSITFDLLLPFEDYPDYKDMLPVWTSWIANTYIELGENSEVLAFEKRMPTFVREHYKQMIQTWHILGWLAKEDDAMQLRLQPLTSIHFYPEIEYRVGEAVNPMQLYILSGIGLIVLAIACINFTTLSVGRSATRAIEVGLRKTLGAARRELVQQFLGEALVLTFLATLVGLALVEAFLPAFNSIANASLTFSTMFGWDFIGMLTVIVVATGCLAGGYPAFFLSRFQPGDILRRRNLSRGKSVVSQILVVVQFSISVVLLIGVFVMSRQITLLKTHDPGFNKEQVLVIPTSVKGEEGGRLLDRFRQKMQGSANILAITGNSDGFTRDLAWQSFGTKDGSNWKVNVMGVEPRFLETFGMTVVSGRAFSQDMTSDVNRSVIVNESLVKELGWKDPIGRVFTGFSTPTMKEPVVIGVVKDFNYASLHQHVKPLVLLMDPSFPVRYLFVRVAPGDFGTTLKRIGEAWREIAPMRPFEYYFLEDDFNRQYQSEERWSRIVTYASLFAMAIACFGLFALSAQAVSRRTKEIGIRKVLGASVNGVVSLLLRDFLKLVVVANVLAWPLAYYGANRWLADFAYRIDITPTVFIFAGCVSVLITLLTVSYQSIRASLANPVDALRYE